MSDRNSLEKMDLWQAADIITITDDNDDDDDDDDSFKYITS